MSTTILIVGANCGLGLHFALQYLKKGFNVYGTYRPESSEEAKELLGSGAKTLHLDPSDENSIQAASKSFGDQPLDILINCAAHGNGPDKWIDCTADQFMERFRVSSVGPFLTIKAFYSQLRQSASPTVISISSNAGSISENARGGNLAYRTSKAALNAIMMDLARELSSDKISCISMSPGWVQTKMSNWTGPMECPEAVSRMIKVIDGLKPSDTGSFYHRDGHKVGW